MDFYDLMSDEEIREYLGLPPETEQEKEERLKKQAKENKWGCFIVVCIVIMFILMIVVSGV